MIEFKVTSECGNLLERLYSAPIGEKRVAREPEKELPEMRSAGHVSLDLCRSLRSQWAGRSRGWDILDTESLNTTESFNIFSEAASMAANLRSLPRQHSRGECRWI